MARPSILRALCTAVAALAVSASVAHAASTLERIRDRHSIVFAYRDGAAPFSFRDRDGHVRGYSVELCSRVAAAIRERLRLSDFAVEWVPVDAATRLDAVAAGRVDAECGTTTITLSRMERVDFSVPIFVDGGALAVALRSPVRRVADLGGRRVAVIPGTTTERALRAALDLTGVKATIVSVARPEEGAAMVRRGEADAYAGDRIVLTQLALPAPEALEVLPDDFSFEPYAIVVARDDAEFRLAVNRALVAIYKRGDIDAIWRLPSAPRAAAAS